MTANDSEKTKSVSYSSLIAPMIEAIKILDAENNKLKDEVRALKDIVCLDHASEQFCRD